MTDFFNILVTSISKKVPLIQAVRQAIAHLNLKSKLYGADSNVKCIASYFVDEFWQMPHLDALDIKDLITYCKSHGIKAIIPTRDGELAFFAKHHDALEKNGISCMVSKLKCIETCYNKFHFFQFLHPYHIPVIPTVTDIKHLASNTYAVKECFGAGSSSIGLNLNAEQAKNWSENLSNPIFQPFITGKEYSVDVYVDKKNTPQGSLVRVRELIVGGESQITYSVQHKDIEALCLKTAALLEIYGHAVFQVLCDPSGHLHLIECNPRFGGASTLSVAMGLSSFEWFLQEVLHRPLSPFVRSAKEKKQVRFPEDRVFDL